MPIFRYAHFFALARQKQTKLGRRGPFQSIFDRPIRGAACAVATWLQHTLTYGEYSEAKKEKEKNIYKLRAHK